MEMDTAEDSDNVENGPKIHNTRMDPAPAFQIVATTKPSRNIMGNGTVSTVQSAAEKCTDTT